MLGVQHWPCQDPSAPMARVPGVGSSATECDEACEEGASVPCTGQVGVGLTGVSVETRPAGLGSSPQPPRLPSLCPSPSSSSLRTGWGRAEAPLT